MSNHPTSPKKPSSWLHAACAAAVLCGGFLASTFLVVSSEEVPEPVAIPERPTVTWQPAPTEPATLQFSSMGRVIAARPTILPSPVSARVTKVHPAFLAGGQVAVGETLVTFDQHDLAVTEAHAAARLAEAEEAYVRAVTAARRAQAELSDDPQALAKASPLRLGTPQQASAKARVRAAAAEYQQAQARSQHANLRAPENIWVLNGGIAIGEQTVLGAPLAEYLPRDSTAVHVELPLSDTQAKWLARKPQTWSAEVLTPTGSISATIIGVTALTQHGARQLTLHPTNQWSPASLPIGALIQVRLRSTADPSLRVVPDAWLTATGDLWYVDAEQRLGRLDLQPLGRIGSGIIVPATTFSESPKIIPGSLVTGIEGMKVRLDRQIKSKQDPTISNTSLHQANNAMANKQ